MPAEILLDLLTDGVERLLSRFKGGRGEERGKLNSGQGRSAGGGHQHNHRAATDQQPALVGQRGLLPRDHLL